MAGSPDMRVAEQSRTSVQNREAEKRGVRPTEAPETAAVIVM